MIQLTRLPIDVAEALRHVQSPQAGAVVLFLGTTREFTNGKRTEFLEYEAYDEMALRQLTDLQQQAQLRWSLIGCALVHRLGRVNLAEPSILVAVSSPHRPAAFEAASWLMDQIKREVPIWKQENGPESGPNWVHPGFDGLSQTSASSPDWARPRLNKDTRS